MKRSTTIRIDYRKALEALAAAQREKDLALEERDLARRTTAAITVMATRELDRIWATVRALVAANPQLKTTKEFTEFAIAIGKYPTSNEERR